MREIERALEVLFSTGNIYHLTGNPDFREMNIEDCWVCGINRSICLDTPCKGDYDLLVKAGVISK